MKDFLKWLGVNEKVAKVVVWIFIFMIMLIIFNTAFESIGLPYYKVTVDNLSKIDYGRIVDELSIWIYTGLEFIAICLLVLGTRRKFKNLIKFSVVYLILNTLLNTYIHNYVLSQLFIFIYVSFTCYYLSKKNIKYILYGILSCIFFTLIQSICYMYKIRFINFSSLNKATKVFLFSDYLIIVYIVIFIRELFYRKRGE